MSSETSTFTIFPSKTIPYLFLNQHLWLTSRCISPCTTPPTQPGSTPHSAIPPPFLHSGTANGSITRKTERRWENCLSRFLGLIWGRLPLSDPASCKGTTLSVVDSQYGTAHHRPSRLFHISIALYLHRISSRSSQHVIQPIVIRSA
jgi:hypothetical protein